jgi:hypothetical protein
MQRRAVVVGCTLSGVMVGFRWGDASGPLTGWGMQRMAVRVGWGHTAERAREAVGVMVG